MISIVICHRDKELLAQVKANIAATIGVEYEVIAVDNTSNQYNIFQAYNKGFEESKYPLVAFAHEDILFHTQQWGEVLIRHFQDPSIGALGTIGGTAFPNCPAPWWSNPVLNQPLVNLIQHCKDQQPDPSWIKEVIDREKNIIHEYMNPGEKLVADVVALDGLFICVRKSLYPACRFDTTVFNGFHCYDTDICLQVLQAGARVVVVFDLLIEHLSMGSINKVWAESVEKLADKWQDKLPVFIGAADPARIHQFNCKALLTYCYWIQQLKFSDSRIMGLISKYLRKPAGFRGSREYLLLRLWKMLGYRMAGIPYRFLKQFYK
ncbi:MAG: glycosyltransferase [Candidatus Pseudobacter hemicellulosilyticus]|uniref:Glycosyltransferase n=1 Tax=Candidatus Pseudobacter hemicellulosilyticus TaxID=3121375 RepID=A0AAJ5WTM4_9BACT|nr:MAG: glycosyltransferase [Pseudobacter sp.]